MVASYLLSSSTVVEASPDAAWGGMLDAPLEELFPQRAGLIPPVRQCRGQEGAWARVGQTRTVVLADGSTNLETLMTADRPGLYRYRLSEFTGPFKLLIARVDGTFSFVEEHGRTRVTWTWSVLPTSAVARLARPAVGFFWRRYAAQMWPHYAARLAA